MTNWKTTLVGAIALIAYVLTAVTGIQVTAEVQAAFVAVILFLVGLFAKDAGNHADGD